MKTSVQPYLTFDGNCEEAFHFYKAAFGSEFAFVGRFKDMPSQEPIPDSEKEKIMHISLPIGDKSVLMGADSSDAFGRATVMGNNFTLSVNAGSKDEADRIFIALSEGGTVTMPMNMTFWEAYFGMCTDRFGIQWMVNFDTNPEKSK